MDQETLFTAIKWDILRSLSQEKKSPMELAQQNNTSISNVSQSLRFLELGGIVKSERISNRDKGKPRVVYALNNDKSYVIVTANNFTDKKSIDLTEHKKAMLRIWFHENKNIHEQLENAYYELRNELDSINAIYLDDTKLPDIELNIIPKKTFKEPKSKTHTQNSITRKITYKIIDETKVSQDTNRYYPIHIPQKNIDEEKK